MSRSYASTNSSGDLTTTPRRRIHFMQLEDLQNTLHGSQQSGNQIRIINIPLTRTTASNTQDSGNLLFPGSTFFSTSSTGGGGGTSSNSNSPATNTSSTANNTSTTPHSPATTFGGIQNMLLAQQNISPPFLENVIVAVNSTDSYWDNGRRNDVVKCCKNLGAKIVKTKNLLSQSWDILPPSIILFVTMYKNGEEYEKILHYGGKNVYIISPHYLNFLIAYYSKHRSSPINLGLPKFSKNHPLFAPLPSKNGIQQMKTFVISVTGFIGTERSDLKFLIKAVGAKYSGALSKKENTHLVCCSAEGEKWRKAREWGVRVVNYRWLWDCVEQWTYLDESNYEDILTLR